MRLRHLRLQSKQTKIVMKLLSKPSVNLPYTKLFHWLESQFDAILRPLAQYFEKPYGGQRVKSKDKKEDLIFHIHERCVVSCGLLNAMDNGDDSIVFLKNLFRDNSLKHLKFNSSKKICQRN